MSQIENEITRVAPSLAIVELFFQSQMEDFGDDQVTFDALDAELANINDKFDRGKMRAFGMFKANRRKRNLSLLKLKTIL